MSFNIGNVAGRYISGFAGDDFVPKTLGQAGILANQATEAMTMIPALNLEAETLLAKQGLINEGALDRQQLIADTYLKLDEMKAERAKNKAIADILFAGSNDVLGVSNNLLNKGLQTQIQKGVLQNSPSDPTIAIPPKGEDITGIKSNQLKLVESFDSLWADPKTSASKKLKRLEELEKQLKANPDF
jgi:hypothetical protein